jgi:hypothetical protein
MAKAKTKKAIKAVAFDAPFSAGDVMVTTKQINGQHEGQMGIVISCDPFSVLLDFEVGPLAGKRIRCPYSAIRRVKKAKVRK